MDTMDAPAGGLTLTIFAPATVVVVDGCPVAGAAVLGGAGELDGGNAEGIVLGGDDVEEGPAGTFDAGAIVASADTGAAAADSAAGTSITATRRRTRWPERLPLCEPAVLAHSIHARPLPVVLTSSPCATSVGAKVLCDNSTTI